MAKSENERLPWFPCEAGKLLSALQAMKPHVAYTYWIVCLRIYEVGGPCPDTLEVLTRRTGYSKRVVSEALDVLFRSEKLTRVAGGIMNPYAESVLVEMASTKERLSARARRGGVVLAEKRKQKQQTDSAKSTRQAVLNGSLAMHTYTDIDSKKDKNPLPAEGGAGGEGGLFAGLEEPVIGPPALPAAAKKGGRAPRAMIPTEWQPSAAGVAHAENLGFGHDRIAAMRNGFVNHHRSRGTMIADVNAAWRNWCDNELKFMRRRGEDPRDPDPTDPNKPRGSGRNGRVTFGDIAMGRA